MNFLNSAFLIGLPLAAIPLVIHLLNRRQQTRISWGAMRFLKEAAARRRRLWRLTDLLLLLLRTAAFLLFICALARPLVSASWLGESASREVIVVIDQSMSMARKVGGSSLFELQREKAHALLETLGSRDSVRLLLAGESPEWLTPDPVEATPLLIRKLRNQLDTLQPTLAAGDLLACIREAADLESPKEASSRVIVVFSDRQKFGWHIDEKPLW
ncbi:MAG: BatA domain-containing protein, partial [Verrucomicrobiota bacterium]